MHGARPAHPCRSVLPGWMGQSQCDAASHSAVLFLAAHGLQLCFEARSVLASQRHESWTRKSYITACVNSGRV